jgi:thiol-disulfide isomerase/thioredoxin
LLCTIKNTAKISGKILKMAGDSILLSNTNRFSVKIPVDYSGNFSKTITTDSASYYNFNGTAIYLEPKMDLVINKVDSVYIFTGKGSKENNMFKQINESVKQYLPFAYSNLFDKPLDTEPADFLKQMDDYTAKASALLSDKTLNSFFVKTQQTNIDYIVRSSTDLYTRKYGVDPQMERQSRELSRTATRENIKEVTTKMMDLMLKMHVKRMDAQGRDLTQKRIWKDFDINNGALYQFSPTYRELVEKRLAQITTADRARNPYNDGKTLYEIRFDLINKEISNDYIKQRLLYTVMMSLMRPSDKLEANYTKYMAVVTDPYYKTQITRGYNNLKLTAPGTLSPQFVYNDTHDKPVDLSSLKGNYVYIDIWATWCGPCKAEIPSLKTVEKKYEHENIRFVSISIDEKKDMTTWKNFVKDNALGGIQVFADNNWHSAFITSYDIHSIPRFILLDPDGKIVSADAFRPSNPALQTQLDTLLKKSN